MSEDTTQQLLVARVDRLISMVEETNNRLEQVETRLESLETKVDQRLHDTRPIWENVQSQLKELDKKFDSGIDELRTEMNARFSELRNETASGFRATARKIGVVAESVVGLTADIRDLQDRLDKIESPNVLNSRPPTQF